MCRISGIYWSEDLKMYPFAIKHKTILLILTCRIKLMHVKKNSDKTDEEKWNVKITTVMFHMLRKCKAQVEAF